MLETLLIAVVIIQLAIGISLLKRQTRILTELNAMLSHTVPDELKEQKSELTHQNRLYRDFLAEDVSRSELAPKERFAEFSDWKESQAI